MKRVIKIVSILTITIALIVIVHFSTATAQEGSFTMDARPSDAIAMALRFGAPLYVDDRVIQKSKSSDEEVEVVDNSEEGTKWAEYLENLSPEDFGKYKV